MINPARSLASLTNWGVNAGGGLHLFIAAGSRSFIPRCHVALLFHRGGACFQLLTVHGRAVSDKGFRDGLAAPVEKLPAFSTSLRAELFCGKILRNNRCPCSGIMQLSSLGLACES